LGLPVTLCRHAHWLAAVPVIFSMFGFDWANAKLVLSTMMIAAMLAIFFKVPSFVRDAPSYDNGL
jgi:hypothetical protein